MSDLDLTPIKDRLARARHLPIFLTGGDIAKARENRKGLYRWHLEGTWDDAVLFGRARDDIAALLAEVERLRAQVQREAVEPHLRKKWAKEVRALSIGDPDNIEDCLRHEPEFCDLCRGREQAAKLLEGPGNE